MDHLGPKAPNSLIGLVNAFTGGATFNPGYGAKGSAIRRWTGRR